MNVSPLSRVILVVGIGAGFEAFLWWVLRRAFRTGVISHQGGTFRRDEDPFNYWFLVTTAVICFVLLAIGTVYLTILMFQNPR